MGTKEELALNIWNIAHDRVTNSPLTLEKAAPSELAQVQEIFNAISEYEAPAYVEPDYAAIARQLSDAQWNTLLMISERSKRLPGYSRNPGDIVNQRTLDALVSRGLASFTGYWYQITPLGEKVSDVEE